MIPEIRAAFNGGFTEQKYQQYLADISKDFPDALDFRVAETPVFAALDFGHQMLSTCGVIIDKIRAADFKALTQNAIPKNVQVQGEEGQPHFLIFDFGVCLKEGGGYQPMLIEMQAFPTLFAYQLHQYESAALAYDLPANYSPFFGDMNAKKSIDLLKELIVGEQNPENTILLELFPEKQKTRIDFLYTKAYLGIEIVCLTQLIREGVELFYEKSGRKIKVRRIYNRIIFDELSRESPDIQAKAQVLYGNLDVKWITHPNWFYRISKYTLPFLTHPNIPETRFLNEVTTIPADLENYVLKPLFSFAGNGVIIDVQKADIEGIQDKENYILQRKVAYAPAIKTMDENAKVEIRVFYLWKDGDKKPIAVYNLARLTKGNMVSVALNKNKTWVGGTFALFG